MVPAAKLSKARQEKELLTEVLVQREAQREEPCRQPDRVNRQDQEASGDFSCPKHTVLQP